MAQQGGGAADANANLRASIMKKKTISNTMKKNKKFAVKQLNKNRFYRIPQKFRQRYLRAMHDEIDILTTLKHPNIIRLNSVYEDKQTLYIVMEECKGGELFQRIVEKGSLSERTAS